MKSKEALDIIRERIDLAEREYAEQVPEYIEALKLSAELLQADANGQLVVLPCKVDEDEESDLTKALRCLASQDPEGDCFMDHENMRRYETGEQIIECCSNPVEGERCPFHQSTYGVCFEDGDCMEWLGKAADEIVMLQAAFKKIGERT